MHGTTIEESDVRTWTFEVDGFHLDAPQSAKKKIADTHDDVEYRDLRAGVLNQNGFGDKFVTVVEVFD